MACILTKLAENVSNYIRTRGYYEICTNPTLCYAAVDEQKAPSKQDKKILLEG